MENLNLATRGLKGLCPCLAGLALLAAGCSHSNDMEDRGRAFTPMLSAQPPSFLTGPMGVLLTNSTGYSARVDAQTEAMLERDRAVSGQLLCRGSHLFFAPEINAGSKKLGQPGNFSFIWDVASNSGYVLSEALQAYAPAGGTARATNVVAGPGSAAPEKIGSYDCSSELAAVQMDNGSTVNFKVMRATGLKQFPVRLSMVTNAVPLTVTFSKVQLGAPGAELFAPPDGFSKYASPEAMSDEIAIRQHNLRRKAAGPLEPLQLPPQGPPPSRY